MNGAFGPDTQLLTGLMLRPPEVANEVYRIGVKELRVDVTDDATGQVLSNIPDLEVIADHSVGGNGSRLKARLTRTRLARTQFRFSSATPSSSITVTSSSGD